MRRPQGSDCEWQICKWNRLPGSQNTGILCYARVIPLFWQHTEAPAQNQCLHWICTLLQANEDGRHTYNAIEDTTTHCTPRHLRVLLEGMNNWRGMYCLPSTNPLVYRLVHFIRIREENKTSKRLLSRQQPERSYSSFKTKPHGTLYGGSSTFLFVAWLMFMQLYAAVVVNEDASPVSWRVHFTDIPDSYSAMFSQHRALWDLCMNPRIPTSLVVCNLNRRNSWHS